MKNRDVIIIWEFVWITTSLLILSTVIYSIFASNFDYKLLLLLLLSVFMYLRRRKMRLKKKRK